MVIVFVSGSPLTKEYAGPGKGAEMAFCTKRTVKRIIQRMNKRARLDGWLMAWRELGENKFRGEVCSLGKAISRAVQCGGGRSVHFQPVPVSASLELHGHVGQLQLTRDSPVSSGIVSRCVVTRSILRGLRCYYFVRAQRAASKPTTRCI